MENNAPLPKGRVDLIRGIFEKNTQNLLLGELAVAKPFETVSCTNLVGKMTTPFDFVPTPSETPISALKVKAEAASLTTVQESPPGTPTRTFLRSTSKFTTLPTDKLVAMIHHYKKLCNLASVPEHPLCSSVIEATQTIIPLPADLQELCMSNETPAETSELSSEQPSEAEDSEAKQMIQEAQLKQDQLLATRNALAALREITENDVCADCASPDTSWASTNLGVFLCIRCSGVHRSLGAHVSSILSCNLDIWPEELLTKISGLGNREGNLIYECLLDVHADYRDKIKLTPNASMEERKLFINEKYVNKTFLKEDHPGVDTEMILKEYCRQKYHVHLARTASLANLDFNPKRKAMIEYCGIVFIELISAEMLQKQSKLTSKLFVRFKLGVQQVNSKKWQYLVYSKKSPSWNQSIQLNLPTQEIDQALHVELVSRSLITKTNTILGKHCILVNSRNFFDDFTSVQVPIGDLCTLQLNIYVQVLA